MFPIVGKLLLGGLALTSQPLSLTTVSATLAAWIVSFAAEFLPVVARRLLLMIYVAACMVFPALIIPLPLLFFDALEDPVTAWIPAIPLMFQPDVFRILLSVFSLLSSYSLRSTNQRVAEGYVARDQLRQDALLLRQLNRELQARKERDEEILLLNERNRLSGELHDVIGHSITSSILQLKALEMTKTDEETVRDLSQIREILELGMTEIRRTLHALRGESFDLSSKLQTLLDDMDRPYDYTYRIDAPPPLSVQQDLLFVAKEGITNFLRHSDGSRLTLRLEENNRYYILVLADDGNPDAVTARGIGLDFMEEIARRNRGNLTLSTSQGFRIHLLLRKETSQ